MVRIQDFLVLKHEGIQYIDSRTKRLRVYEATVINQTYKYSILNLVCEGLNSKYRSY